jgi:S-adenosylmethionine synthetase
MTNNKRVYSFTSESVSEGHPDKVADQISDSVLDAYLQKDPNAKVACEVLITGQTVVISGEVKSNERINEVDIARNVLTGIGYNSAESGFDTNNAQYINLIQLQSPEIFQSVVDGGAGDQGLMFGYATNETKSLMPMPIQLSHRLMQAQADLRKKGAIDWLLPDAKSQVTIRYENEKPVVVEKVVFSSQHRADISQHEIRKVLIDKIIDPLVQLFLPGSDPEYLVNPSGSFTIGGPQADTGLTGRKIIVDTYGGSCPHGGGAFSGKDPSKVDRTGAYAARFIAKHIVHAGLAERCTVQLSYAIGKAEPTSVYINTHGTGLVADERLTNAVTNRFNLTPEGIISDLNLKYVQYAPTASYGHFGRDEFSWENISGKNLRSFLN